MGYNCIPIEGVNYFTCLQWLLSGKPNTEVKLRSHFQQRITSTQFPKTVFGTTQLFNFVILIEL